MDEQILRLTEEYGEILQTWNRTYEDYAKSVGLSYTSLSVLSMIYATENCTQKMICETRFLPKQTVNSIVTSFYKKGWLKLKEMPDDRRNKIIVFTPEGRKEAERLVLPLRNAEKNAMKALSQEQREALTHVTRLYAELCAKEMQR